MTALRTVSRDQFFDLIGAFGIGSLIVDRRGLHAYPVLPAIDRETATLWCVVNDKSDALRSGEEMNCVLCFVDEFGGRSFTVQAHGIIPVGGADYMSECVAERREHGAKALRVLPESAQMCTLTGGAIDAFEIVEQTARQQVAYARQGQRGAYVV